MTMLIYTVLVSSIIVGTFGIGVCDLESLEFCEPSDRECMIHKAEPGARKWFIHGRSDYFLKPLEPYVIEDLTLKVNQKIYKLQNIKITGFNNMQLTDWRFDISNKLLQYDYDFKLDVTVEKFLDKKGRSIIKNTTLTAHLVNKHVVTNATIDIIQRCNGEKFFKLNDAKSILIDKKDNDVVFEEELETEDRDEIVKEFGNVITLKAHKALAQAWREFTTTIPMNKYWNV